MQNFHPSIAPLAALALLALSCGEGSPEDKRCRDLSERKLYAEAAPACEAAYAQDASPELGVLAARAAYELEDDAGLATWASRLAGSAPEPRVHGMLAASAERAGRVEEALGHYAARLALEQARGDHRATADTAHRAFYLAWKESRIRQALEAVLAMSAAAEAAGDPALESRAAQGLFTLLYSIGDLAGAAQALERAGRLLGDEDPDRANWWLNEAALRLEEGRPALASAALLEARALAAPTAHRTLLRSIELNLAEAALATGALNEAATFIEAAEALATTPKERVSSHYFRARLAQARGDAPAAAAQARQALAADPAADWRWELEWIAGQALAAVGDVRSAEAAYGRSIGEVEGLGNDLGASELRASLLDHKRQPYEAQFELLLRQGRSTEALTIAERAVSRSATDAFLLAAMTGSTTGPGGWRPEAALARSESLAELRAALAGSRAAMDTRSFSDWLKALGERRILFYFQAGALYYLAVLTTGRVEIRSLGAKTQVEGAVDGWLTAPEEETAATALGELLLPGWIETGGAAPFGRLVVIPDGAIARVSFAALRRGKRRVVESFTLSYAPSLAAVVGRKGSLAGEGILVLGDPQGDLPAARLEGREVAAQLQVSPRVGSEATLEALRRAGRVKVLHLATHAGVDGAGPWLRLADGELRPAAVLAGMAPELVVLASCDSAGARGRGLAGSLPAAFLAAGSRAVVAALGSVEDAAARRFVRRFYAEGGAGQPAEALARTQRAFAASGEPLSSWAPFVISGSL